MNTQRSLVLERVRAVPVLPAAVQRLLELVKDPDVDTAEIEQTLRLDPGLTANLLRLANAPCWGCRGEIGSVRDAIMRLGTRRLMQLVVTASVGSMMEAPVPGYGLPAGEMWRHSLGVAVGAEAICRTTRRHRAEDAFTAGLLHDVGKLVMGELVVDRLSGIGAEIARGVPFDEAERSVLGTDHATVGGMILEHWGLPERLVTAVRFHHTPDAATDASGLVDVVHVADSLAMMIGLNEGCEGLAYRLSSEATQRLGLDSDYFENLAIEVTQALDDLAEGGVQTGGAPGASEEQP